MILEGCLVEGKGELSENIMLRWEVAYILIVRAQRPRHVTNMMYYNTG